jgi:IS30 family transposase
MNLNLRSMIEELEAIGFSEAEIAALVGCSQPTINRLKTGIHIDTKYTLGKAIEALHRKIRRRQRKKAEAAA